MRIIIEIDSQDGRDETVQKLTVMPTASTPPMAPAATTIGALDAGPAPGATEGASGAITPSIQPTMPSEPVSGAMSAGAARSLTEG